MPSELIAREFANLPFTVGGEIDTSTMPPALVQSVPLENTTTKPSPLEELTVVYRGAPTTIVDPSLLMDTAPPKELKPGIGVVDVGTRGVSTADELQLAPTARTPTYAAPAFELPFEAPCGKKKKKN